MGAYDEVMDGLRERTQQVIGDNALVLAQHGAAPQTMLPTPPEKQWWNLPAKYEAARRIKSEILAAYPGHDDAGDALRHAELSRRMAAEIDPLTSTLAGLVHEAENTIPAPPPGLIPGHFGRHAEENWHGQRWPERRMDLHNNAEGLRAAAEGRGVDPRNLQDRPAYAGPDLLPYGARRIQRR